ncbi:ABC transporter permease [Vallitalea guaymasensis]|uniref:ABC transporter permease n=1 Tax=Vallitalea guaymasensis TaxID=1185412 RepID=A0A8J8MCM1_9FIRM|nr:ABC transporter permease [Vallitalea guaymasensis]QUH30432.1 ABC transporter permease [Vallitalea guaymasensis]
MEVIKRITKMREFMIFSIVFVIFIVMSFASPYFLSTGNILALMLGLSLETIIAVAMANLMVSGGFDMSVGSVVGFVGAVVALTIRAGVPVVLAVLIGLIIGGAIGCFNGFIISKIGINPFVTTLASLSLFRGLTLILTKGQNITGLGRTFKAIGQSKLLGIQAPIWYAIILVIIGDILLRKSRFFRQNYYIGGNEKAAILSGIKASKMKILNYSLTGLLAGFAGIVMASRLGAASVTAGTGLELRVITAVIIGGASLSGGEGTVVGAFFGAVLMALITNALTLLGVDVYWQTFVIGATLLIAVLIDQAGKVRKERKKDK